MDTLKATEKRNKKKMEIMMMMMTLVTLVMVAKTTLNEKKLMVLTTMTIQEDAEQVRREETKAKDGGRLCHLFLDLSTPVVALLSPILLSLLLLHSNCKA